MNALKIAQILSGYTLNLTHMSLGLIPEILYSIDMVLLVCKQIGMVGSIVLKL